jgi:hypothetical protein
MVNVRLCVASLARLSWVVVPHVYQGTFQEYMKRRAQLKSRVAEESLLSD